MQFLRSFSDLSTFIRINRQKRGWTQAQLANQAGLAEKHVNRIENGVSEPRISTVIALLSAMEFDLLAQEAKLGDAARQSVEDMF